jgi:hypothetical protein
MSDRGACHEVGGELIDDGADHRVEVRDLVMQFEVSAGEGLETDTVGGFHIAIGAQVRPPSGQDPDELHASHRPQQIPQSVGCADDRALDHLQGNAPRRNRRLPASLENP